MVLERRERINEYYTAYGDDIARHYENNGVVVFPYFPLQFDLQLFQAMTMPEAFKKLGVATGLEQPVLVRSGEEIKVNSDHVLFKLTGNPNLSIYLQSQIMSVNWQIRLALKALFPRYTSLTEGNITWRLTEAQNEGLHVDGFGSGKPFGAGARKSHRIKLFINIDSAPRQWHTSLDLPSALKAVAAKLPKAMPDNINTVNGIIGLSGVLRTLPAHKISFPTLSAVLANGELLCHEIVHGRRMIAAEYTCPYTEMLQPDKHPFPRLADWLRDAGIQVTDDPYDTRGPQTWLREAGIEPLESVYT
jgi:hypothetical protein